MDIRNRVAFVTGANRGLGKAYAQALLEAGASKVYAGARDPAAINGTGLVPVKLDVTSAADIAAAAAACGDVFLLVNNAGVMRASPAAAPGAPEALAHEMAVNVFGLLNMARAFAPVLARNGGGVIVNMLSVVSWFANPFNATYCASKYAALALSDALRIELKGQGTRVVGVYAGFVDTDMTAGIDRPKVAPQEIAAALLQGLRDDADHVLADQRARDVWRALRDDPGALAVQMRQMWDAAHPG